MNYLRHASKHISSSYGLSGTKKPVGFMSIVFVFIICLLGYYIFGGLIGDAFFGIKNIFASKTEGGVELLPSAYDAKVMALEIENKSLVALLTKAGVKLPKEFQKIEQIEQELGIDSEQVLSDLGTTAPLAASTRAGDADSVHSTTTISNTDTKRNNKNASSSGDSVQENDIEKSEISKKTIMHSLQLHKGEIIGSVLIRPPQSPYDALVVNVGSDSGVEVGDQVYAFSGFPIGEVVEVKQTRSTVKLLSAPGSKIDVLIGTSTTSVTAEGKGAGNFFLKLPKVTEISKGDVVARNYLPPEVFSTIESVDSQDGEAYIYAYFKLPIQLNSLVYVLIKKNSAL